MSRALESRRVRTATVLPPPSDKLRLRIRLSNGQKKILTLTNSKCTIGSQRGCTIRVPAKTASGVECILIRTRDKVIVRNWGAEGTINGSKFEIASLKSGDTLRVAGCAIRILKKVGAPSRIPRSASIGPEFGKRLVGEIGKRLAHLEDRLLERQKRWSRRIRAAKVTSAIQAESPPSALLPPPVVLEGLNTLRSTVEELRSKVEQVAERPWPNAETPSVDAEAILARASRRLGEVLQTHLQVDRVESSLKFEQVSRDFHQVSDRLGEIEKTLNLRVSELVSQQIAPVSHSVEFVRSGLQSIAEQRKEDAARIAALASGLDSLRQSTLEQLGAVSDRLYEMPSVAAIDDTLLTVNQKIDRLALEISDRNQRFFTNEDAAKFLEQLESTSKARQTQDDERNSQFENQFQTLQSEWTAFQAGAHEQFESLSAKVASLPTLANVAPAAPVDLTQVESSLAACEAKLIEQTSALAAQAAAQEDLSSQLDSATSALESMRVDLSALDYGSRLDHFQSELSSSAAATALANEASRSAQEQILEQLVALENRCEYLESELARLSRMGPVQAIAQTTETTGWGSTAPSAAGVEVERAHEAAQPSSNFSTPLASATFLGEVDSSNSFDETGKTDDTDAQTLDSSALDSDAQLASRSQLESQISGILPHFDTEHRASDDPIAEMPGSIVQSLRRSGIWKDEDGAPTIAAETMEDPRDIVGSNYRADEDVSVKHESPQQGHEQPTREAWSPPVAHGDHDEESIDAYMERLLQRVSSGGGEVTGAMAVAEHLQKARAQASKKKEVRDPEPDGKFEYTPRVAAPEKSTDLTALRELAMTSANANIQSYHAATKAKSANEKWVVVVVAILCAIGLLYICVNYQSNWTFLAAGAAFVVALYWAILASFTNAAAKKMLPPDPNGNLKPAINLARRKSDQPGAKSLLDMPSAGETFQALVAERERQQLNEGAADALSGNPIVRSEQENV